MWIWKEWILKENEVESPEQICLAYLKRWLLETYILYAKDNGESEALLLPVPKFTRCKPETDGGQENLRGHEASLEGNRGPRVLITLLQSLDPALSLDMSQQSLLCSQTSLSFSFCHLQPEEFGRTKVCFRVAGRMELTWCLEQININYYNYNNPYFKLWHFAYLLYLVCIILYMIHLCLWN